MIPRRGRWRPLQEAIWLLVAVATISMVITLHLGNSLTWLKVTKSEGDVPHGELDLNSLEHLNFQRSISNLKAASSNNELNKNEDFFRRAVFPNGAVSSDTANAREGKNDKADHGNSASRKGVLLRYGNFGISERDAEGEDEKFPVDSAHDVNEKSRSGVFQARIEHQSVVDGSQSRDNAPVGAGNNGAIDKRGQHEGTGTARDNQPRPGALSHNNMTVTNDNTGLFFSRWSAADKVLDPSPLKSPKNDNRNDLKKGSVIDKGRPFGVPIQRGQPGWTGDTKSPDLDGLKLQALHDRLTRIESMTFPSQMDDVSVVVKGQLSSVKHHLPLMESAFHKFKAKVTFETAGNDILSTTATETGSKGDNWSIVICLNTTQTGDNCIVTSQSSNPRHQKVNIIPKLNDVMVSPSLLCDTKGENQDNRATHGQWCSGDLPCYSHDQAKEIVKDEQACDNAKGWWIVSASDDGGTSRQFVPCGDKSTLKPLSSDSVVVPLPKHLLTLDGSAPLVWQVEVLVTSLSPPRVYLHPSGLAWEGLQEYLLRKHLRSVSLHDLHQLITELHTERSATLTLAELEAQLMHAVRGIEKHVGKSATSHCPECFQLLDAVFIFNSTFHPFILELTPSTYSERLTSLNDYILEQNILEDLAAMLMIRDSTVADTLSGIKHLGLAYIQDESICTKDLQHCVDEGDLTYLLSVRRELKASKNWIRLFPSSKSICQQKHLLSSAGRSSSLIESQKPHSVLEEIALSIEQHLLCPLNLEDQTERRGDARIFIDKEVFGEPAKDSLLNSSGVYPASPSCDRDANSVPYLSAIYTRPYLQLYPEFSPLMMEYQAFVDYNVTLIQVSGIAKHCQASARLEDKLESNRWSNFSLGIGENTAHILVVDVSHLEPYVVNTYKLTIYRRGPGLVHGMSRPDKHPSKVCSLKQDCSLPVSESDPCGLQHFPGASDWSQYLQYQASLPLCGTGVVDGQWMVPCMNCHEESSCDWDAAIWQPTGCCEGWFGTEELQDCFAGKKVLFIGDSTNRGILHYIVERLNGSLMQWDKTHNIRIYSDLNQGQTVFGFAYYPQFWLAPGHRPMFDKALSQLIQRTEEWPDMTETVIVLGGVHWLGKHHLDLLVSGLERAGLTNAKVVVKGLGAGFHQPISGVHQLSMTDHQRLFSQNEAVLTYAQSLGFSTVDTYRMTMARYKDFLQGKCACHFHKVSPIEPSITSKLSHKSASPPNHNTRYHVEGTINSVYSEMVINRICSHQGG